MIAQIRVPKIGMVQENITVVRWLKADGETVKAHDMVVVIETAKVDYEVEAPAPGLVFSLKKVKEKVKVGDTLGVVASSLEEFEAYKQELPEKPEAEAKAEPVVSFEEVEEEEEGIRVSLDEEEEEVISVQPAQGPDGRNVLKRIPIVGMRRAIANNLVSSLQTGAQLTIVSETDLTELARLRQELMLDRPDTKITFVDILVKLLASVLKEFPIMNSSVVGDEIMCWGDINIGVAVALEDGLVVPVVRNADTKSLMMISREIKKLSQKARQNELEPAHYQGSTFTLSSGGKVDVDIITPIINPPENAILAIGKIGPRSAVHEGKLAIRTMTHLCLTHDHRAIDGVPAANFLGRLKETIERPELFRKILR
jgi:pyruvate/2-oxoglutarate dehydrogenase complex dihydrolipoamide acyltransferase (E2) component